MWENNETSESYQVETFLLSDSKYSWYDELQKFVFALNHWVIFLRGAEQVLILKATHLEISCRVQLWK